MKPLGSNVDKVKICDFTPFEPLDNQLARQRMLKLLAKFIDPLSRAFNARYTGRFTVVYQLGRDFEWEVQITVQNVTVFLTKPLSESFTVKDRTALMKAFRVWVSQITHMCLKG